MKDEYFKSLLAQNAPNELSFSEYKTFSNQDIDRLYPINLMPEANKQAKSLLVKVNMTNDENLNKILFDKELVLSQSIYKDYFKVAVRK